MSLNEDGMQLVNADMKKKNIALRWLTALAMLIVSGLGAAEMQSLPDGELSKVSGQALFVGNKQTNATHSFYSMGFDAKLELNTNIRELKLGETSTGVDLWAKNLALGCVANGSGVCVDSSDAGASQLLPFTLMRPFVQLAIKNDNNRATREVVGFRLGAENASGPMSIGNFEMFSGYLSATANIAMLAQGQNGATDDVAVTCGPTTSPCPGSGAFSPGTNTFGLNEPLRSLGLNNDQACVLSICAQFKDLTVRYGTVTRNNLPVTLSGRRQNQALISNVRLNDAVNEIVDTLEISRSNSTLSAGLINIILPIVSGQMADKVKGQFWVGLGLNVTNGAWTNSGAQQTILNNHQIPFNVQNLHSVMVNSPLFGLSFQKESVQYPGYAVAMQKGWSMYLPNAFTLSVSEPTTQFVSNIMSGAAAAGNIVALPANGGRNVFDNCWGAAKFC